MNIDCILNKNEVQRRIIRGGGTFLAFKALNSTENDHTFLDKTLNGDWRAFDIWVQYYDIQLENMVVTK